MQSVDEIVGQFLVGDDRDAGRRPSEFGRGAGDDRRRDSADAVVTERRCGIIVRDVAAGLDDERDTVLLREVAHEAVDERSKAFARRPGVIA